MRLHRFFITEPMVGSKIFIKEERLLHQWRNVFRYNTGTELIVFDGSGLEYDALIAKMGNREVELEIVGERKGLLPERQLVLYQSLIKKDKMEWVVEKATELGVTKIIPIISERSEKKGFNLERACKIAIEASEQCGRADVPEMGEVMNMEEGIKINGGKAIVFDPSGGLIPNPLFNIHSSITVFIGPEGGWSDKELEFFRQNDAQIYSLGRLTLRAETAAIVALGQFI